MVVESREILRDIMEKFQSHVDIRRTGMNAREFWMHLCFNNFKLYFGVIELPITMNSTLFCKKIKRNSIIYSVFDSLYLLTVFFRKKLHIKPTTKKRMEASLKWCKRFLQ